MAFAHIYKCPVHGEIIDPYIHHEVDVDNDEVYEIPQCNRPKCYYTVKPVMKDGRHVIRPLTDKELESEKYYQSLDDDDS